MEEKRDYCSEIIQVMWAGWSHKPQLPSQLSALGRGEFGILFLLQRKGTPMSPSDISKMMHIGSGRVGNALKDLEKKNFIKRTQDKKDKRKYWVSLTAVGKTQADKFISVFEKKIQAVVKGLGEEDFSTLLRLTQKAFSIVNKEEDEKKC